jgi:hypothetical protein
MDFQVNVCPVTAMIAAMQMGACPTCGADAIVTPTVTIHLTGMSSQCSDTRSGRGSQAASPAAA